MLLNRYHNPYENAEMVEATLKHSYQVLVMPQKQRDAM